MRLVSPALLYLRWLLVHPDKYGEEIVVSIMKELGLDYLSLKYVQEVKQRIATPVPFRPYDATSIPSRRFIIREGLLPLVNPDTDVKIALNLVRIPRVKEFLEAALMTTAPLTAVVSYVSRQMGTYCTVRAAEYYQRFFWDTKRLDSTQLRALLIYRSEVAANPESADREERVLHGAIKKASYNDPRKLASELPNSPVSAMITQMRMGVMPSVTDMSKMLEVGRGIAMLKVIEAMSQDGPRDSHRALNYSLVVRHLSEVLEKTGRPEDKLHEDLSRIALKTDTRPIPSIHELSAGEHTVDLSPALESHEQPSIESGSGGNGETTDPAGGAAEDASGDAGIHTGE